MFKQSKTQPSVLYEVDSREYHKIGSDIPRGDKSFVMSRGNLVAFAKNPHKWLMVGQPKVDSDSCSWGSLIDCLVTDFERFDDRYVVCPETYPSKDGEKPWNWNANHCKEWRERVQESGKECIKSDVMEEAQLAFEAIGRDKQISDFVSCSRKQVQVLVDWHDSLTGLTVPFKALLDFVPTGNPFTTWLGDLKTTNDASERSWQRQVYAMSWHVQAAMYLDAYNAATGEERNTFVHVVQESEPPYETARRMLSEEFIEMGRQAYHYDFRRYCDCLFTGSFPGYDGMPGNIALDGWTLVEPPRWAIGELAV